MKSLGCAYATVLLINLNMITNDIQTLHIFLILLNSPLHRFHKQRLLLLLLLLLDFTVRRIGLKQL